MQHRFFALISRMRYIGRWGLMRNTFEENVQEHSHMVAVLAHGLAMIQRDILHQPADPDRRRPAHAHQILQPRNPQRLQGRGGRDGTEAAVHAAAGAAAGLRAPAHRVR